MPEKKKPAQLVRDCWEQHIKLWQTYHDAIKDEREFSDGDRYQLDSGTHNRDRRLVQIRGKETIDEIRHIVAKVTEKARSLEARPRDMIDDPDTGEVAVSLCDWELSDPWKGFDEALEEALIDARESRVGAIWMDWDPDCGPFGELTYRRIDMRRCMHDPAYSPHHPLCGWFLEQKRVDVEKAKKLYKADWLISDRDAIRSMNDTRLSIPLIRGANGDRLPDATQTYDDNKVTLWFYWLKNDPTVKATENDYRVLEPEDRYQSCLSCGEYRTGTQGAMQAHGELEGDLPEYSRADPMTGVGGCPQCGGDLKRIDAKAIDQFERYYAEGRRLIIIAPFSPAPDDEELYDGDWPIPSLRSFPLFHITARAKGGAPMGSSDTYDNWDQQLASDQLRTLAVQRIFEHRTYWEMPRAGIVDAHNRRFAFRENQSNIMYRDNTVQQQFGSLEVKSHDASGLDMAFPIAFNTVQTALTQFRPAADISQTDVTGGKGDKESGVALAQRNAIAETQTAHFRRRVSRALGMFCGVLWDAIRATYTHDRLTRLRLDGIDITTNLSGDELPNYDFAILETPEWTGLEKQKADAFEALFNVVQKAMLMGMDPMQAVAVFAELNNLPRSVVRKFEKLMASAQQNPMNAAGMGGEGTPGGESNQPGPAAMNASPTMESVAA